MSRAIVVGLLGQSKHIIDVSIQSEDYRTMNKMYFPLEWIQLQKEIMRHHMELYAILQKGSYDIPETLGAVGAYVGISIDGLFTSAELQVLCKQLTVALVSKRPGIHLLH